ncbi:MAG: TolC family protein [Planctomycetota bacterium]
MKPAYMRTAAYLQLGLTVLMAVGCTPTQPFFLNESPDLQYYLSQATQIEYPDVDVQSLPDTVETLPPLTIGNHDYQFWNLTLEEAVAMALQNAKFFITTSGIAETRQNVADQFISGTADQFGSIYDIAIQQSTTQSVPLTVDGNGNRVLPRGVLRASQVGGIEDALAEFDAQSSGFLNYSNTDRPANSTIAATQSDDFTSQSAISKRIVTGGVATLRHNLTYGKNNLLEIVGPGSALRNVDSDYTVTVEAQVQHPLMRNRGTLVNRIPVVLASLNEDISISEFEIQVRNLVRDVEVAYWDLYVAYRAVSTSIIGRNSAIVTAQFAKLALENGTGTRQEVSQSVEQFYQFRSLLEAALAGSNVQGNERFGVYGSERRLRELLGISPTDGRLIRPIDEPTLARVEFDWHESIAQTLYLSPELRQTKSRIKQSELELVSAKNQILPEVNLSLLYRWVGVGDHLGPPGGTGVQPLLPNSSALETLTGGDFQEGSIRLDITPAAFGARRELARIRGAKLRLAREKVNLQEKERLAVSRLSEAVAKTATHYQQVQSNAQRWQAAEQEVEARLAEFKGGRSPVNVVLQSQQRRAQAQIDYYRALGEYNKSINYVDFLKGTLLPNNNIVVQEGVWNSKAYWDALERARERSAGHRLQYGVTRPGVIRRGPVMDAEAAGQIVGSGHAGGAGVAMPPGSMELLDPNGELGIQLEPFRDPVDVEHTPLSEMGDSMHDFTQPVPVDRFQQADPGNSILEQGSSSPAVAPDNPPITPVPDVRPDTASQWGSSQRIQPAAHTTSTAIMDDGYAPEPVRRTPLRH